MFPFPFPPWVTEQRVTLSGKANGGGAATAAVGVRGEAERLYELRVYSIRPDRYAAFCRLMAAKFHLRLAYSRPLGYWLTDLGGIFQAVHIWPYGRLLAHGPGPEGASFRPSGRLLAHALR